MGNANPEFQKVFTEAGRLNMEIALNKDLSNAERNELKRKANQLMGREFHTNIEGESDNE